MAPRTRSQAKGSTSDQGIANTSGKKKVYMSRGRKRKSTATIDGSREKTATVVAPHGHDVSSTADIGLLWFFYTFKPSSYEVMKLSESMLKQDSETFQSVFAKEIEAEYGFPAEPDSVCFRKPNQRLFEIPDTWKDTLPEICTVSTPIPPNVSFYDGIGEDLWIEPRSIHLFVTADRKTCISWIFFSPEFLYHFPRPMEFTRREFDERTMNHQLAFTTEIKTHYNFHAEVRTLCFWKPNENLSEIPSAWRDKFPEIQTVSTLIPSHLPFSEEIGKNIQENPRSIHLFVTAKPKIPSSGGCSDHVFMPYVRYNELMRTDKCFPSWNQMIHDDGRSKITPFAPPIHIYHPIFTRFNNLLDDPQVQPTVEYLRSTCAFMSFLGDINTFDEDEHNHGFRRHISKLMGVDATPTKNWDKTVPDGCFLAQVGDVSVVYGIIELGGRKMGLGSKDPSIRARVSMLNYWRLRQEISDNCCCPTLIITRVGSWLAVMGGVITDKVIVQPLTDLTWMGLSTREEKLRIYHCSRILNALRITLSELKTYYEESFQKLPKMIHEKTHPRYYPFPDTYTTTDGQNMGFEYLKPLQSYDTCVTYLARCADKSLIVVKFVSGYGEEVHRFLADEGYAPALRYCGPLPVRPFVQTLSPAAEEAPPQLGLIRQRMRMVVMDYVQTAAYYTDERYGHDDKLKKELKLILTTLHAEGFVLGDLRPPNALITPENHVKLIDFDWSGRYDIRSQREDSRIPKDVWEQIILAKRRIGKKSSSRENVRYRYACYPLNISTAIEWANGTQELGPILPEHDWEMFHKL